MKVLDRVVAFLLSIITIWLLIWWMDRYSLGLQLSAYIWTMGSLGNALPFLSCFLVLLLLTNRLYLSFFLTLSLGAVLYVVSFEKFRYLGRPLSEEDFVFLLYLDESVVGLFSNYVNLKLALVLCVVGVLFIGVMTCFGQPFFVRGSLVRKMGVGIAILFSIFIIEFKGVDKIYDFNGMRFSWANQISILHAGLVSKVIYGVVKKSQANDVAVNLKDVGSVLDKYSACAQDSKMSNSKLSSSSPRPDLVIIQSESFFDPSVLQGNRLPENILRNYRALAGQGDAGYMKVPTFGGGTIRTEYEVLTGINLAAYPLVQFPYLEMNVQNIDSLASEAKKNGYESIAIHGNVGSFWNRSITFKSAGFDKFLTADDFPPSVERDGVYVSDKSMTDLIVSQLSASNTPKLIFAISIEGHGPYNIDSVQDQKFRDSILVPEGLSAAGAEEYRNYVYHVDNADQQLGRLKQYLDARDKPYILAFYGDHLPALNSVYEEIPFRNGLGAKEQWVPWVVTSNTGNAFGKIDASWKLGAALVEGAGFNSSPYFTLVSCLAMDGGGRLSEEAIQAFLSVARAQVKGQLNGIVAVQGEAK